MKNSIMTGMLLLLLGTAQWGHTAPTVSGDTFDADETQRTGIQFFQGTWEELLAEASRQGKLIFVDVYTDWCGPCKRMAQNIFPLESVGNVYNELFISYKLDAEKGEGPGLARKYQVRAYPTYLFLSETGELVERALGYKNAAPFIEIAAGVAALAGTDQAIGYMKKVYASGKKDKAFLRQYVSRLTHLNMDTDQPLDDYLDALRMKERVRPDQLQFLATNVSGPDSRTFAFVMDQGIDLLGQAGFAGADYSHPQTTARLAQFVLAGLREALNDAPDLARAKQLLGWYTRVPVPGPRFAEQYFPLRLRYYNLLSDPQGIIETANAYVKESADQAVAEIRAQDEQQYARFMQPFLEGSADSSANAEAYAQRKAGISGYPISARTAQRLDFAAQALLHDSVRDPEALRTALSWSEKAMQLIADDHPARPSYRETYDRVAAKLQKSLISSGR